LIPSVEEPVMVTPEVVDYIYPVCLLCSQASCGSATGASPILTNLAA